MVGSAKLATPASICIPLQVSPYREYAFLHSLIRPCSSFSRFSSQSLAICRSRLSFSRGYVFHPRHFSTLNSKFTRSSNTYDIASDESSDSYTYKPRFWIEDTSLPEKRGQDYNKSQNTSPRIAIVRTTGWKPEPSKRAQLLKMAREKSASAPGERQKFYFQFITTPTSDTPGTTILLHFDNRRYFFGQVSEGTQRACVQRGVGIKKVRNVFLTGATRWSNMGGLIGMILTMADVQHDEIDLVTGKRPRLRIQGGPKLTHSIACARRFVFRTGMPLETHEVNPKRTQTNEPIYVDENINVWAVAVNKRSRSGASSPRLVSGRSQSPDTIGSEQTLRAETVRNMFDSDWRKDRLVESRFDEVKLPALIWVRNPETKELNFTQCATMADAPHLQPESKVLTRNPWPASMVEELPPADNIAGSAAVSYIARGKPQRGKFLPQKAKELGVKPGPNNSVLAAGGSVTLEDGRIITSDMVLGDTEPGKGMAIFDIPSEEYLEDFSEKLQVLMTSAMEGVEAVSWLLGKGVASNPVFVQIVQSLPNRQHIICSSDLASDYLALDSASASSIRLSQVRPECFRVPVHDNVIPAPPAMLQAVSYVPAERGLIVQAAPTSKLNKAEIPSLLDVEETMASYREILSPLLPSRENTDNQIGIHDDVQILTLGTGSAVPSKYRNVSGTLLRIPNEGSFLFDCGENTIGTLKRAYTTQELEDVLVDLRMIWISHLHADHHLGTLSVIDAKRKVMERLGKTEPKLYVVSEPNMADYLNDYSSIERNSHCELLGILNSELCTKNGLSPGTSIDISSTSLPIKEFLTTRVSHCHGAQACSVIFENGFKFSYSGDCRPSAQFAKIGLHSDVLLHEATFDDGLEGDAMAKKHSTTAEALAVALKMKAKNVILTHFSQRYQKIPVLTNVKLNEVRFEEGNDAEEAGPVEDDMPAQNVDQALNGSDTSGPGSSNSVAALQKVAQDMNICVAFDLMSVSVGQIRDMYKYYPAIERMFELEHEKSEAKKDERREAGESKKEQKDGKSKVATPTKGSSAEPRVSAGNLYERINRNNRPKVPKGANTNGSAESASNEVTAGSQNSGQQAL